MQFRYQKSYRDCFPTCFINALHYFDIPIIPVIAKRLEVFYNGTENCTIYSSDERLEQYERSIHKLISEWNWACNHKDDNDFNSLRTDTWALYLLEMGIQLEFKNGPIEQNKLITDALLQTNIVICEVLGSSSSIPNSEAKHFVLLVKLHDNTLFIHDPLPFNHDISSESLKYKFNRCGSNVEIDSCYFFSNEVGPMKPKLNQYQTDWGYKFIIVSRPHVT